MKILTPLCNAEYIDPYIQAGADEFYFGFYDNDWFKTFGKYSDINRMSGFGKRANPHSFEEIISIIKKIKSSERKAFVTMNANGYSKEQIQFIEYHYLPQLQKVDVDGIIVSDINAITSVVEHRLQPIASTMCAIYNSDVANIYKNLGVQRMILPRDLSLNELSSICKTLPDIHFEAFFMRNGCIFSDSYCLGLHRPECGATCTYTRYGTHNYQHNYSEFKDYHDVDTNDYLYRSSFLLSACAMCALYRLKEAGIKSLKIVGRADEFELIRKDIKTSKMNIEIANQVKSEQEYLNSMIFPDGFPHRCRMGYSCYYPEIRFN